MTKTFCDRCEELIPPGNSKSGDFASVPGPKTNPQFAFTVEIKIGHCANSWMLCKGCANEIIDQAYQRIREERRNPPITFFDKMRKAAE